MSFVKCDVLNEHAAKFIERVQHLLEGLKARILMCYFEDANKMRCAWPGKVGLGTNRDLTMRKPCVNDAQTMSMS